MAEIPGLKLSPTQFVKYRKVWDRRAFPNDLDVEAWCYRNGLTRQQGGLGRFGHFRKFVDGVWNNPKLAPTRNFVWNDWSERMIRSAIDNRFVAWAGAASSGKSDCAALFGIVEYLTDPMHTLVIITSTTLTGARQRIWKSVDQLWNAVPALPGKIVPSVGRIKGANLDARTYGDATGLFLLASEKKKEKDALGKLIGIKATKSDANPVGRLILIADELPELPESLVHAAFTNLWANEGFKMIALGNPASFYDAFGIVCKPTAGWDSVSEGDEEWETPRGKCLRFDGECNPRILGDERCNWMYSKDDIDRIKRDYGEKSIYYWRMVKAFWAPQGAVASIYSPADIHRHGAGKVTWGTSPVTRVAGLDPSYSHGGDRSILFFGTIGEDLDGKVVLQFDEFLVLQEDLTNKTVTRSEQIVRQFRAECEKRGVSPRNVAYDGTGASSFGDIVTSLWSPQVLRVNFAGAASDRPATPLDSAPASSRFANRVSELWGAGLSLLRNGQLKGITDELAKEMCARTYQEVKGKDGLRMLVEPKTDYKARTGESPDIADAAFVLLDLCRQRHHFRSGERPARDNPRPGLRYTGGSQATPWQAFVRRNNLTLPSLH